MKPNFLTKYEEEIRPQLLKEMNISSVMGVPRLEKIVISMGLGAGFRDQKYVDAALRDLTLIAGQKCVATRSRRAEAGFKIREGMVVGAKVTLRRRNMYFFLERLITMAIPRIRDFRGFSRKAFDQAGHYSLGLNEQLLFVEVDPDTVYRQQGMNICFCFSNGKNGHSLRLMEFFGFPFKKVKKSS